MRSLFLVNGHISLPAGLPNVGKSSFFNVLSQTGKHQHPAMAQNVDTIFPLIDLGKAANFPYATIEPEVRPSTFVSRSTIEFFTIGSSCSCPRCSIRLAMRALQTRLPRSRTPDLHRYRCSETRSSLTYVPSTASSRSFVLSTTQKSSTSRETSIPSATWKSSKTNCVSKTSSGCRNS